MPKYKLQPSELEEFASKYGEKNNKVRAWVFVNQSIACKLIEEKEEFPAYLLYNSCESRINSCRYGQQKPYLGVKNDWSDSNSMCRDIINHKPEFWKEWVVMTCSFVEAGQILSARPTIDRVLEQKSVGYCLENIAVLSHGDNASKALSKPCYVFQIDFDLENSFNMSAKKGFKKFKHKKEALRFIGINNKVDTGRFYEVNGKHYLIQSEAVTLGYQSIEEYEYEEDLKEYSAWVPIGIIEDSDGERKILKQQIIFPHMAVVLKAATHKNT